MESLFHRDGELFVPSDAAGGPWHPELLHGGAVSGLMTFAVLEALSPWPEFRLARITVDMMRPVPKAPLAVSSRLVRDGGRVKLLEVQISAGERVLTLARAVAQRPAPAPLPDYAPRPEPAPEGPEGIAEEGIQDMLDAKGLDIPTGFHTRVVLRPLTPFDERGQGTCWIHVPLNVVAGEPVSPLMHLGMVADLGNGVGQLNYGNAVGTINVDISLHLFRHPRSTWVCLESGARAEPDGMGVVNSRVFDEQGLIGHILQTVQPNGEYSGG